MAMCEVHTLPLLKRNNFYREEIIMHNEMLKQPEHLISLSTSAMLVSIDMHTWSATKTDIGISNEVTTDKKASEQSGRFVKNLLSGNPIHKSIKNYQEHIRKWLVNSAYQWSKTQYLLPSLQLEEWTSQYKEHEETFNKLVDDFCGQYDTIKSNMKFEHGDMYNEEDYPNVEEVRRMYRMRLSVAEVPEHDFRCNISKAIAEDLKTNYEQQTKEIVDNVLLTQQSRIADILQRISKGCEVQEATNDKGEVIYKKGKIYESTFKSAQEMCKNFKDFQPVKNELSDKVVKATKSLENVLKDVDITTLQESDAERHEVKNKVDDILSKFI